VYKAGVFSGNVDYDLGTVDFNLSSVGVKDGFICKLDVAD
jgi:hypothetical protein